MNLEKKQPLIPVALWGHAGVPQKGWECDRIEDMETPSYVCEMCGTVHVRYVHVMKHKNYAFEVGAGCVCASKMSESYNAKKAESLFKKKLANKAKFRKGWKITAKGNHTRVEGSNRITIGSNRYGWWILFGEDFVPGKWKTFEETSDAVFVLIEEKSKQFQQMIDNQYRDYLGGIF